jgi:ribosomal protein S18 acetylase RimI-like enzyme
VPAIRLYEKLGFARVTELPTPYARVDIQMELKLK